jgi:CHAT domain-containing protein
MLPPAAQYARVSQLFLHGELSQSERLAGVFARRYQNPHPDLAIRFKLLEAEAAAWRGLSGEVLDVLSTLPVDLESPEISVQRLSLLGLAHAHLHEFKRAQNELAQAKKLCSETDFATCGELLRAQGGLAVELGDFREANRLYAQGLRSAQQKQNRWDEAAALMNLGTTALREEKFDEALGWSVAASQIATQLDAGDILLNTIGNQGWANYKLGNEEKALAYYRDAEQRAVALGDAGDAVGWLTTTGYIYEDQGNLTLATQTFQQALQLARKIKSNEDIVDALEDLTHAALQAGQTDIASSYIQQISPMIAGGNNPLDGLAVKLAQAKILSAHHDDHQAEILLRSVENDESSQTSMRMGAEHELAELFELRGDISAADGMYRSALNTFEGAREQLQEEDSKLPFLANATRIYDDYIHFLVTQGRVEEALSVADQSRARTLAQGLGTSDRERTSAPVSLSPQRVARKAGATLLFYWLGEKQSYLWAVTPKQTVLFPLPAKGKVSTLVERYNRELLGAGDPLDGNGGAGQELYAMLVAPAAQVLESQIDGKAPVMVLTDGALSLLNFETLIAPASKSANKSAGQSASQSANTSQAKPHYWIEDATVVAAPSLAMLATARQAATQAARQTSGDRRAGGKLLLLGDAVSPEPDYPELPYASLEMREIEKHFAAGDESVFARHRATSEAYLHSNPRQFSYIHFVSHGVASRTDPLDSAIILSRSDSADANRGQGAFKLYAREIMQHPIDARVVIISACYSSGTRAFAGEGLVGLSWAFLRAGAHSTIGALWEVNDNSTARLMGSFYEGLEVGQSPAVALRNAKLNLLHGKGNFRKPFYWAPFQLYTRM